MFSGSSLKMSHLHTSSPQQPCGQAYERSRGACGQALRLLLRTSVLQRRLGPRGRGRTDCGQSRQGPYRAILSLQDMVSSRSPCSTPSHVWMLACDRTGIVPSPDSIFVRSCPLAFRFGCLSAGSKREKQGPRPDLLTSWKSASDSSL